MSDLVTSIRERYLRVLDTITNATRKSGREPDAVRLVVVTKMQPVDVVRAAIDAGARILGENYAEEAAEKIEQLGTSTGVEWHMIGHVQSRKAQIVAHNFALVHSLDSLRLAQRLDRHAGDLGRSLPVLLELNLGGEASKHGWDASKHGNWPALVPDIDAIASLPHIQVLGLMTMPPLSTDPETARPFFRELRRLQEFLSKKVPQARWDQLSMGTSTDYVVAVEEGATLVRVGQAIIGPRPYAEAN